MNKRFLGTIILLLVLACAPLQPIEQTTSKVPAPESNKEKIVAEQPKNPRLTVVSPKDGELIKSSKVTVELQADNFKIVPVGEPVKESEGHLPGSAQLGRPGQRNHPRYHQYSFLAECAAAKIVGKEI